MNNGKLCVSVCAETADEMIANIRRAEEFADVIEVRFDSLDKDQIEWILKLIENFQIATPMIAKFCSIEQLGISETSPEDVKKLWQKTGKLFWAADIERKGSLFVATTSRSIASFHDFDGNPENLDAVFKELSSIGADLLKVAIQAHDVMDAIPVWKFLERAKTDDKNVISVAMGEAGKWTRILGLAHGAFLTYASLQEGGETAPGQITAKDMIEVYRVKELDFDTKVFGVIGDPVSGSLSPYMQNAAFVAGGVTAVFIPLLVKNLDEFIRQMVRPETREIDLNFGGFSVTMPHKQAILKHLDVIDPTAEKIGAVNTVKIDSGKLIGYNTDAHGFITPLKAKFGDLKGARVAVFGTGGAARACVFALKEENAVVTIFARDLQKANALADEFDVASGKISKIKYQRSKILSDDFDILVNATPLGMKGQLENESLFTADQLEDVKFVYDLVTRPDDTPLMLEAKKANIPAIGGLDTLIAQGTRQFEIWTGKTAPIDMMKQAVLKRIDQTRK